MKDLTIAFAKSGIDEFANYVTKFNQEIRNAEPSDDVRRRIYEDGEDLVDTFWAVMNVAKLAEHYIERRKAEIASDDNNISIDDCLDNEMQKAFILALYALSHSQKKTVQLELLDDVEINEEQEEKETIEKAFKDYGDGVNMRDLFVLTNRDKTE